MLTAPGVRQRTAIVFALTALVGLVACGSNDDPTTPVTTTTTESSATTSDGVLKIGTLLPETGALKLRGPSEFAGVDLAVQEINDLGGVLGKNVEIVHGDSGDATTDIAVETVNRLRDVGVDAIIGPASTAVTLRVIDAIAAAGIVAVSPADYSDILTGYADHGMLFRTAAPNRLEAFALAQVIADDGNHAIAIAASHDAYGDSLSKGLASALTSAGAIVVADRHYDPKATVFDDDARAIADANPDAVVVIGFEESADVIKALASAGVGPQQKKLYGADGNMGSSLADAFPPGALAGMKGTTPLVELTQSFKDRLLKVDSGLEVFDSAAEAYDAVITVALAAAAARSDAGTEIAKKLIGVSRGGTRCTTFAACIDLLKTGADIDYDGVSGAIDFDKRGDPTKGSFGVLQFGPQNELTTLEYRVAVARRAS